MAVSRRRRRLGAPLPLPTTKKPRKKPVAKKKKPTKSMPGVSSARPSGAKARVDAAIASIRDAMADVDAQYYAIGKALIALRKPEIWKLYAAETFREFLDDNVMPHSTAERMITIAESYPKTLALTIGLERSFQLARLARIDPDIKASPAQLWKQNPTLGDKRVRQQSAADLERLARAAVLKKRLAKAGKPPATRRDDKEAVEWFRGAFLEAFEDLDADIRFNPRKRTVRIEFHVEGLHDDE